MRYLCLLLVLTANGSIAYSQAAQLDSLLNITLMVEIDVAKSLFLEAENIADSENDQAEIHFYKFYWYTNSQGNGWRNIQTCANLIKSQIEIDSNPGRRGTSFILTTTMST